MRFGTSGQMGIGPSQNQDSKPLFGNALASISQTQKQNAYVCQMTYQLQA
jgi:hypothetical protein